MERSANGVLNSKVNSGFERSIGPRTSMIFVDAKRKATAPAINAPPNNRRFKGADTMRFILLTRCRKSSVFHKQPEQSKTSRTGKRPIQIPAFPIAPDDRSVSRHPPCLCSLRLLLLEHFALPFWNQLSSLRSLRSLVAIQFCLRPGSFWKSVVAHPARHPILVYTLVFCG